jgi:holo-[acyl-carrier protein] synthase
VFALTCSTAEVLGERGITAVHLTMSHDGGLAIAHVILERTDA